MSNPIPLSPEQLAKLWHESYEEVLEDLAKEQRDPRDRRGFSPSGSRAWDEIPTMPRKVFVAVCAKVLDKIDLDELPYPKRRAR